MRIYFLFFEHSRLNRNWFFLCTNYVRFARKVTPGTAYFVKRSLITVQKEMRNRKSTNKKWVENEYSKLSLGMKRILLQKGSMDFMRKISGGLNIVLLSDSALGAVYKGRPPIFGLFWLPSHVHISSTLSSTPFQKDILLCQTPLL